MQTVIKLPPTDQNPSTEDLDGWIKTEGNPQMKTWALHTSAAGDMVSGIWECTVGSYHATYTAYEYVVLIAGRIVITPDGVRRPVAVSIITFILALTGKVMVTDRLARMGGPALCAFNL